MTSPTTIKTHTHHHLRTQRALVGKARHVRGQAARAGLQRSLAPEMRLPTMQIIRPTGCAVGSRLPDESCSRVTSTQAARDIYCLFRQLRRWLIYLYHVYFKHCVSDVMPTFLGAQNSALSYDFESFKQAKLSSWKKATKWANSLKTFDYKSVPEAGTVAV